MQIIITAEWGRYNENGVKRVVNCLRGLGKSELLTRLPRRVDPFQITGAAVLTTPAPKADFMKHTQ